MKRIILLLFVFFAAALPSTNAEEGNSWIQWRDGYLTQVEAIKVAAAQKNEAVVNSNDHAGALQVAKDSSLQAIKELGALQAPAELEQYQQKLIEGYKFLIQASDAWLRADVQEANKFSLKAVDAEKQSYKELRRVSELYGAPKEDLDTIDKWLVSFQGKEK